MKIPRTLLNRKSDTRNSDTLFHVDCFDVYKMNHPRTTIASSLFSNLAYKKPEALGPESWSLLQKVLAVDAEQELLYESLL